MAVKNIKPGEYQTRDGSPVRIICVDAPDPLPVVGIMLDCHISNAAVKRWLANGNYRLGGRDGHCWDLVEPKAKGEGLLVLLRAAHYDDVRTWTRLFERPGTLQTHLMEHPGHEVLAVKQVSIEEGEFDVPKAELEPVPVGGVQR